MNADPTRVREKRRESSPLSAVQPGFWEPGGPMPAPFRAEPLVWLAGNRENDGITWRCLENESHMANPGGPIKIIARPSSRA